MRIARWNEDKLMSRSLWPGCLRHECASFCLLRLGFRIPPRAWMPVVKDLCCQVEFSASGLSLTQMRPTKFYVSEWYLGAPWKGRRWPEHRLKRHGQKKMYKTRWMSNNLWSAWRLLKVKFNKSKQTVVLQIYYCTADILVAIKLTSLFSYLPVRLWFGVELWFWWMGEVLKFVEGLKIKCEDEENGCYVLWPRLLWIVYLALKFNGICFTNVCLELSLKFIIDKYDTMLSHVLTEELNRTGFTYVAIWIGIHLVPANHRISRIFSFYLSVRQRNYGSLYQEGLFENFFLFLLIVQTTKAL
jgi:hypothetical protein